MAKQQQQQQQQLGRCSLLLPVKRGLDVVEMIIRFETSNRWPDDPMAIMRIKTAFYIQLHTAFQNEFGDMSSSSAHDHIDVLFAGFCFRMRILYDREMAHRESLAKASAAAIMQQQQRGHYADDDGVVLAMEKAKIPARAFRRDLIARPKHHSLIRSFSLKHPTYGPACRIAKRWAAAHLFSSRAACSLEWMEAAAAAPEDEIGSQLGPKTIGPRASLQPLQRFPDEAIELIVAAVYVNSGSASLQSPASSLGGFIRFLDLLGTHPWKDEPLIVDVNDEMSLKDKSRAAAKFVERRGKGGDSGGAAMYIITKDDPESKMWTSESPSSELLRRITTYARASSNHLRKRCLFKSTAAAAGGENMHGDGVGGGGGDGGPRTRNPSQSSSSSLSSSYSFKEWKTIFKTPLESFDIFIMLDPVSLGPIASLTSITKMMGRKKKNNNNNNSKKTKREGGGGGGHDDGVEENKCLERALPGFDPVDFFVKDLQISVGKYLEIGYDIYGAYGGIVVAKWKNDSKTPRKFSVATAAHLCPVLRNDTPTTSGRKKRKRAADSAVVVTGKSKIVTSSDFVVPDVEGIIQTIKRIGAGIVQEVFIGYAAYLKATKSGKNKK
mmetsp:Transcript_36411/g.58964  ORF Transcript_36411/g.58964 Transcript_36411/m.58964 type:complete len:609 (+) Transcript_36411:3-1829(+)